MTGFAHPDQASLDGPGAPRPHGPRFAYLRRRLLLRILTAYLTPLVVVAVYFHFQFEQVLKRGIDNHLLSVAENQRNTADLFLEERVANTKSAFRSEHLAELPPPGGLEPVLGELRRESPTFVDLGLFTAEGTLVRYAGEFDFLLGKDYGSEPWFRGLAEQASDHLVSDVYQGFRQQPHMVIAVRRVVNGKPWILRASVDPVRFREFVTGSGVTAQGEAFIVNRAGERQTLTALEATQAPLAPMPRPSTNPQIVRLDVDGTDSLCAFAWLAQNDWALVVRMPAEEALHPIRRARLVLTSILVLAAGLIVFFAVRNTTRVIGELERADRSREELKSQLFNAAKLASVGEMAAGVAHEINNPLAIIHEEAGMMLDMMNPELGGEPDMADFRERLGEITDATIRGRNITAKLLAFSRRHDTEPEPTDMRKLIDRVLAMKEVEFRVSDIEVRKSFDPRLPDLLVNPNQLEQVLLNLLNNAKDAMPEGGRIEIRTARDEREARISIKDAGCGMTSDQLERIFFPFYTTKEVGKGTGLGLSISYGIVKAHGGRIEVESEPGKGTSFSIFLPMGRSASAGN